jgi:glycosyltransferase involved in cell wall biosynthesis
VGLTVAHIVSAGEIGGAERMLRDLATKSDAREVHHQIVTYTSNRALVRFFEAAGIALTQACPAREDPLSVAWRSLGPVTARALARVLARLGADAVHVHTFASQMLGTRAARLLGLPVVRTEHSTRVFDDPSCWPFARWSLRRAAASVAISEDVRRVALTRAPWAAGKSSVIPNGVDTARFAEAPMPAADAPFRFVLVARLEPRKGVDIALRALAAVPAARLDIVGDGPEKDDLAFLAVQLGVAKRVRFLGYQGDPRATIAAAHAALASSRKEGLGIALLEAMALGRAVVAVPVGGIPEIVVPGETGLLAEAATSEALAAAMRALAADPVGAARLGSSARRAVVARFDIARTCEAYTRMYRALTSR